ncbi:putative methyltransferase [Cinnamomum micranthum f. kanehirae]|uniref:Putative methyltransferase n=1 Tax=Cinnamomum micranthum f. kanehirae TaxID=337451 RepID=A0A3S3NMD1_9MAGN|nr:putative methyltransferase [Cinnamomum micranthum f. kanehirae]
MNDVVEKLVCDDDIRDIIVRQITDYKRSHHSFGSATAVRNRAKMSPENWWDQYGIDCPELQTLAI